jgi:hypothetical protein
MYFSVIFLRKELFQLFFYVVINDLIKENMMLIAYQNLKQI